VLVQNGLKELQVMKVRKILLKRGVHGSRVATAFDLGANERWTQRQTVIGQFYQLDRLVVEGGTSVCTCIYQRLRRELELMAE
jgi:hypothetical protein